MKKRLIALFLCMFMLASLVAVSSSADGYKEDVIIGTPYVFSITDPQGSNLDTASTLATLTHETLTELDGSTPVPGLATWVQEDALNYVFTIPEGVTFTNGEPCTARDIQFTFERARDSSFTSGKIATLESTEVLSDTEIRFTLSAPNQDFLTTLAHKSLSILSEKTIAEMGDEGASIGTGMFYLTEWIPNNVTTVVRYDGYHGDPAPTRSITFRHIEESSARIIALQTGEVDVIVGVPDLDIGTIEDDPNCTLVQIPDVRMRYLCFNVNKAPFDDVKVRDAVAHAVNKENVVLGVYEGLAQQHHSVVNATQFGLDETIEGRSYDPELAKAELAEAGYPDGIDVKISCYKGPPYETIAQIAQADMAPAGIRVTVDPMDPAGLKALMKEGGHEMACYAWTDADGTDFTVRSLLYSTSGSNRCKIADPVLDKMIDDALIETDVATREQMYKDIQHYADDLCLYIPLTTSFINAATRNGVEGIVWKATDKPDYRLITVPAA